MEWKKSIPAGRLSPWSIQLSGTDYFDIESKTFSQFFRQTEDKGFLFTTFNTGFDITLLNYTKYFHFATVGFRELYLKPNAEFIYLLNNTNNFYVGTSLELTVDFFAAYGHLGFNLTSGGAIGYKIGENRLSYNVYAYFNIGLN